MFTGGCDFGNFAEVSPPVGVLPLILVCRVAVVEKTQAIGAGSF